MTLRIWESLLQRTANQVKGFYLCQIRQNCLSDTVKYFNLVFATLTILDEGHPITYM
jgi:hypothetical protein